LLVVTRLVIETGGSVTQSTESCHLREPHIVVSSAQAQLGQTNESQFDHHVVDEFLGLGKKRQ
ncbi:MAG: hypothetical protein QMC37_08175, partial [Flavobacteriales bacterium]